MKAGDPKWLLKFVSFAKEKPMSTAIQMLRIFVLTVILTFIMLTSLLLAIFAV